MSTSQQKRINDYMKLRKRIPAKSKEKRQRNKKAPNTKPEPFASDTSISDTRNAQTERDMKILRMFDLDPSFGPSVDSTRMERWERAMNLGLSPPMHVKNLINSNSNNIQYTHSVWQRHSLLSIPDS
nr:DNA polymerase delta subunit 4-like isoform X1 [Styela clava]